MTDDVKLSAVPFSANARIEPLVRRLRLYIRNGSVSDLQDIAAAIELLQDQAKEIDQNGIGPRACSGLPVEQEPKFTVRAGRIVNRASGQPIPDDEPVFVLRAKDREAVYAIMDYRSRCLGNADHYSAVDARVGDFLRFKERHPERMKAPDTARADAEPRPRHRAYYETHEPPHCPTCGCGLKSTEAAKSPQAPIARVTVRESAAGHHAPDDVSVTLYAPGLPPGEHDLYCEPTARVSPL